MTLIPVMSWFMTFKSWLRHEPPSLYATFW